MVTTDINHRLWASLYRDFRHVVSQSIVGIATFAWLVAMFLCRDNAIHLAWMILAGWLILVMVYNIWQWRQPTKVETNTIRGKVLVLDTKRCHIESRDGLVATLGISDLAIIKYGDVTLVATHDRIDELKKKIGITERR